jgi:biotin carboxyl carrier protein
MQVQTYKVYVKVNGNSEIILPPESTAFHTEEELEANGYTYVDEGTGDRFHHAQGNYLNKPIMTDRGVYRYKLIDGVPVEKTEAELIAETPQPTPSELRESAYNTLPCITWDNKQITVTQAAILWAYYSAEGDSVKAGQLQTLIAAAKKAIRLQYPD